VPKPGPRLDYSIGTCAPSHLVPTLHILLLSFLSQSLKRWHSSANSKSANNLLFVMALKGRSMVDSSTQEVKAVLGGLIV